MYMDTSLPLPDDVPLPANKQCNGFVTTPQKYTQKILNKYYYTVKVLKARLHYNLIQCLIVLNELLASLHVNI